MRKLVSYYIPRRTARIVQTVMTRHHENDNVNTNKIEQVWGKLKQWLSKFNGVKKSDLQMYCDHFSFNYNLKDKHRFWHLLKAIAYSQKHISFD